MNKKERIAKVKASALLTSKEHKVAVGKSLGTIWEASVFVSWLNGNIEGVPRVLPPNFIATEAENTTGRGTTLKVFDQHTQVVERVFFPSPKLKYKGFGIGEPQLRNMASVMDLPPTELWVRQGSKKYWYNEDVDLLFLYFIQKYQPSEEESQSQGE